MTGLSEKERLNAVNEVRILASIKKQSAHVIGYREAFVDEDSESLW